MPQFMPSSYIHYAVDFDNDGKIDLWNSIPDIVASVANYLKSHGWNYNEPARSFVNYPNQFILNKFAAVKPATPDPIIANFFFMDINFPPV